ncbi:hypothetical protein SAMN02910298_02368 [Pseudobutyrivibrio sp. YE44]|uniref:metallophosphoesterase n=1 Tax=Pseudobutyrivibrio sp. YE44 TaxID=1520802 RepID=UPI00088C4537|nr:metallophosphoesterase [Pseudobutyrivibrio sp. YE44]SDB47036.1 hypothetical protein SAMN02910298_02368 [Pseudobutyrivibrio sp. YE44]
MRRKIVLRVILYAFLLLALYVAFEFFSPLVTTNYDLSFSTLPEQFDGYKIVQISDFHCKEFGYNEDAFIKEVKQANPDLILFTGDIVDEEHPIDNARLIIEGLRDVAPMYYVTGNHEYYDGAPYDAFKDLCVDNDVKILDNETVDIEKNGAVIKLSGLDYMDSTRGIKEDLGYADSKYFNILMYHDAAKFVYLSEFGYDLVFTGHIHGGLVRIPFVGGLFASDYTFFPNFDKGIFKDKRSVMVESAGLGDARVPRWNNPREIVVVKLHVER